MNNNKYRFLISCPDSQGLVSKVSKFIADFGGNITEAHHYLDVDNNYFFMRNEIEEKSLNISLDDFKKNFIKIADTYNMSWQISRNIPKKMLIMGSSLSHCVADLLHRNFEKELDAKIIGILSNHKKLNKLSNWYKVPFKYIPIKNKNDIITMNNAINNFNADIIVLARYMQIIPKIICDQYKNRIINIHHSFLPSFKGASPYKQALKKGVKLIGATCHFVNDKLDDGAIIEQAVERVSHKHSEDDMRKIGQDIEKITLARGLKLYLEDRIIVHNNKTIIFD